MDKKVSKKMIAILAIAFFALVFIINMILGKITDKVDEKMSTLEEAVAESTEADESTAEDTVATEEDKNKTVGQTGLTEEEFQEYKDAAKATLNGEAEVTINDGEGEKETRIGSYTVDYDGSYASFGTINVAEEGITSKMVVYNDGDSNDVKGYFIAYPFMENVVKPTTIGQCKSILSELIPDGSGIESEWEEGDSFFVRKISGYSKDDNAAVIAYTLVPKSVGEGNIYQIIYTASKSDNTITPISEESFNSARDAVIAAVDDVELFETDYETTKEELKDIAYYETAATDSLGGIKDLKDAHKAYLEEVYGTTDVDSLTDEEKYERYWKYMDPTGYAEYQYYENGIGELNEEGEVVLEQSDANE